MLEQQPLLLALSLHQYKAATKLASAETKLQLPALDLLGRGQRSFGLERARIPNHHRAGPVVARGNHRLESEILHRVVLGPDGEPFIGRI